MMETCFDANSTHFIPNAMPNIRSIYANIATSAGFPVWHTCFAHAHTHTLRSQINGPTHSLRTDKAYTSTSQNNCESN